MNKIAANWFIVAIVVVLILLAIQAEPITAFFGYLIAILLGLALIISVFQKGE